MRVHTVSNEDAAQMRLETHRVRILSGPGRGSARKSADILVFADTLRYVLIVDGEQRAEFDTMADLIAAYNEE